MAMSRLETLFKEKVISEMRKKFNYSCDLAVPRLEKIVISQGLGKAVQEKKRVESAVSDLTLIAGQKPLQTRAKKAVSNFKTREGMVIGTKVTLRRARMYEFLDRLISVAIPRIKDFRGYSPKSFDGQGNYNFGITDQIVFPEINPDTITFVQGMNISITCTAKTNDEGLALLRFFGFPFRDVKASAG